MKYSVLLPLLLMISLSMVASAQKIELINSGDLLQKGVAANDSGQYKKALFFYNKIGRNDTNYVRSLYERALTCEADSQYKQAIKYCQEALSLHEQREYVPDLYTAYGNALHDDGQPEKALSVFDAAIAKFPSYGLLYFNKAVVLLDQKRFGEAEQLLQKTLLVNPYLYSAHYQLGLAALKQGKIIPAFLCFTGYLLVNPSGKYWGKSINYLNQISKSTDEILGYKNQRTANPDENYQGTEDVVLSKIALDAAYKPIIALDDPISRQIQAVFEKLEYHDNDPDFYAQYYLPYYKNLFTTHQFEPFINHIFSHASVTAIQEYGKKNKKLLDGLTNDAALYFNLIRATRELNYTKREPITTRYYYESGKLVGKGVLTNNGKTLTGHWDFYYPAGNIKGLGEYNSQGGREGEWRFYFTDGNQKAIENYLNGKLSGQSTLYFENGNPSSVESYSNGQLDGESTTYYYAGNVKSRGSYKLGKKEGEMRTYYANGNLNTIKNYNAGVLNGTTKQYYKTGGIEVTEQYINGKADGEHKGYSETGHPSVTGRNDKDKASGEWSYYYDNGKLKEKITYANDTEDGTHEEYFESGQLSAAYNAKKGKIDGQAKYYYPDGKVLSIFIYENGAAKSVKYFDEAGGTLSASELRNGLLPVLAFDARGFKRARYSLNMKAELTGPDTLFYPSGKVEQILHYDKGELNGPVISYHHNGRQRTVTNYKDGKEDGYVTQYYTNGKTEVEGWFVDGQEQGEWDFYGEKGRLTTRSNYLDNDLEGYKEEYNPDGTKSFEQKYHYGWLENLAQFDNTGKLMSVDSFPRGTGKYTRYYPNKKIKEQGDYIHGDFDGPYKTFFFDGSPETVSFFKKGLRDSTYINLYYGGIKYSEGAYKNGSKTGEWKFYEEDGKLSTTTNYVNDQKNGPETRWRPNGKKNQVSSYKDDELNGTYIKYAADGGLAYQMEFTAGMAISYTYAAKDGQLVPPITIPARNGMLLAYFSNGKLVRECGYSDGKKNGKDIMYYPDGRIWSVDSTSFAISEGTYREYYPNGTLKAEYPYATDNVDGVCHDYNANGTMKKEEHYDNGSYQGTVKYFDETGKLIKTMWYLAGTLTAVKNEQ